MPEHSTSTSQDHVVVKLISTSVQPNEAQSIKFTKCSARLQATETSTKSRWCQIFEILSNLMITLER